MQSLSVARCGHDLTMKTYYLENWEPLSNVSGLPDISGLHVVFDLPLMKAPNRVKTSGNSVTFDIDPQFSG